MRLPNLDPPNPTPPMRADPPSSDDKKWEIEHNDDAPPIIELFPTEPAADRRSYTLPEADKLWIQSMAITTMITQELTSVG